MTSNRRNFLAAVAATVFVAAAGGMRWIVDPRENYIVSVLRKKLDYVLFDDFEAYAFARDYVQYNQGMSGLQGRALGFVGEHLSVRFLSAFGGDAVRKLRGKEEDIAAAFLLSSDFFYQDPWGQSKLRYRAFFDPYINSCDNVFASIA